MRTWGEGQVGPWLPPGSFRSYLYAVDERRGEEGGNNKYCKDASAVGWFVEGGGEGVISAVVM